MGIKGCYDNEKRHKSDPLFAHYFFKKLRKDTKSYNKQFSKNGVKSGFFVSYSKLQQVLVTFQVPSLRPAENRITKPFVSVLQTALLYSEIVFVRRLCAIFIKQDETRLNETKNRAAIPLNYFLALRGRSNLSVSNSTD